MLWLDRLVAGVLAPLAMWVLASGLDDLLLDLFGIRYWVAEKSRLGRQKPAPAELSPASERPAPREKKIALLIPAWREDAVIEHMLDHNIAAIQYSNYEIFVGVYPNDIRTLGRVAACEEKYPRVHHVVCPHDGPTSKADCLNWVYQGVLLHEESRGCRFEIILHHDAEDLIHPQSLEWINRYGEEYDMVQAPVLPLATPWWKFTHGTYCDEFAQSQLKDLHVRQKRGGFLPSCGVGTAYRRRALDRLAWNNGNVLFQPESLTEDYHIGLDLHRLGCKQILLDAERLAGDRNWMATREYFPLSFRRAVRQKARWVAGIALQSWQEIGWDAGDGQVYWLWRDRKGLFGNPLTILANLIFLYGLGGLIWARNTGQPWYLAQLVRETPWLKWLLLWNTGMIFVRLGSRAFYVWKVYGWKHALISPVRSVWGNVINFSANLRALGLLTGARLRHQQLHWLKTDHSYPSRGLLQDYKRRLGEVLVEMRLLAAPMVEEALRNLGPGERLGEHLVRQKSLGEAQVYAALARQQSLPFETLEARSLEEEALERLPRAAAREMQVVPVRITHGRYLWVAGPELPSDRLMERISQLTHLNPRFTLITPSNYQSLCEALDTVRARAAAAAHAG
ncbi:MAG: phage adsorption protein NrfB [Acidobacteria bacterium]|nr:phage adsorption protein NrfB [Acidobacteriota bacterium]